MSTFVIVDVETGMPLRQMSGIFYRTTGGLEQPRIYRKREVAERAWKRAMDKGRLKGSFEVRKHNNSQK
jgi:hypothetical protein